MDILKICLAIWITSVMMTILVMPCIWDAWLIPHLIAKSSALVDNTFIVWWTVLVMISYPLCMCETEVVILFLILISDIINIVSWLIE